MLLFQLGDKFFSKSGKRAIINVAPGQLVAYDYKTGETHDESTLSKGILNRLVVGIGVDLNGDGVTDSIRKLAGERFYGCMLDDATAEGSTCGIPEIVDIYFKCTECDMTYDLEVQVTDNYTRGMTDFWGRAFESFTAHATVECCDCEDCDPQHNCQDIVYKWADDINGAVPDLYPDWKQKQLARPIYAAPLYNDADSSKTYCFGVMDGDCENCTHVGAVTEFTYTNLDSGAVETVALVGNVNPADNTQTLVAQLTIIAEQINDTLGYAGSAYVGRGYGGCCDVCLFVNTCDAAFTLLGPGVPGPIASNPFEAYPIEPAYKDCNTVPATETFACGLRIIAAPEDVPCDCCNYPEPPQLSYVRTIEAFATGDGWQCGSNKVIKVQKTAIPQNFGSEVKWHEYRQEVGGDGRQYRGTNHYQGWIYKPDGTSRLNNAITHADCNTSYCKYAFLHQAPHQEYGLEGTLNPVPFRSGIFVPEGDAATKASVEAFFNQVITLSPSCDALPTITCG